METVIIIGAMKAGTTTLFNMLAEHPKICPCITKEPEFFSPYPGTSLEKYCDLFDYDPSIHSHRLEASTGYSKAGSSEVPSRIREHGVLPKLIYILRDPFERIESHYNYMVRVSHIKWQSKIGSQHLIDASDYNMQINRYLQYFSKNDLLLLDFEDLKKRPATVRKNTYKFLRVEPHAVSSRIIANKTNYSRTYAEVQLRRFLWKYRAIAPAPAQTFARKALEWVPKIGKAKTLSSKEKRLIHMQLAPGMRELEAEFGFDTGKWGF